MRGFRSDSYGDAFADVYDDWYADITDLETTVAFVADLATANGSRPGSVLELGVGTGRLALPLRARVAEVTGVDTSRKMLERLASADPDRTVKTVLGDMVDDLPSGQYDVVLAAYNTVFNLTTAERQQACFDRVADALAADGAFVVEAFVPRHGNGSDGSDGSDANGNSDGNGSSGDRPRGSQVTVRSMTADSVVLSASVHDATTQMAEGQFIEISETGGVRLRPWSIRWADPAELDRMAAHSGLRLAERWADYDRSAFDDTSDRHVTVYTSPGKPGQVRT
ncbi:MAG: class I SAM-dependent methyltransferase [Actinobacteria bacterium]|nr:class I SAM-dependent methyltransferase [Actinomycetota bacterium]